MFKKFIPFLICVAILLSGCTDTATSSSTNNKTDNISVSLNGMSYPLEKSGDAGQSYIDSFIFLGESTTYHLKSRGVLSGGKNTDQVWGPKSGTLMLDPSTASCRIVYPETEEEIDISEAVKRKKPKYILLTFGLNGAAKFISKGKDYFISCYEKLINTIVSASPDTEVMLQSCFPVAKNMDMTNYSISISTLNEYIDVINEWSRALAKDRSIAYLNTAEILKNEKGALIDEYQAGDGYHLTKQAYIKILEYIRTHAHPKEEQK